MVAVLASASRASMAPLVTEGKKRLFFPKLFFTDNAFWLFQDDFACWPPYFHASTFKEWWCILSNGSLGGMRNHVRATASTPARCSPPAAATH